MSVGSTHLAHLRAQRLSVVSWLARPAFAERTVATGAVVFMLALVARVLWIRMLPDQPVWIDEREFAAIGASLASGHGYAGDSFRANPVVPFYLSLVFRLFGERYDVARLGQALIGAATCVLLYRTGALLAPAVGVIAGVLLALYPPHVYLAGVFYVDCFLTFFLVLLVHVVVRGSRSARPVPLGLAAGMLLGLAMLTRPIVIVFLPCLPVCWLADRRRSWRARAVLSAASVLGLVLTVLPWTIRNHRAYGRVVPVSSGFATKLWQGNNELAVGGADDRDLLIDSDDWRDRLARQPEPVRRALEAKYAGVRDRIGERARALGDLWLARDEVLLPIALGCMTDTPGRTLMLAGRKLATLFSPFSSTETENEHTRSVFRLVAAVSLYPILVLACAGAWLGRSRARTLAPVYLLVGSVTAAYALLTACTRFRLPLDPYLILLAALAVVEIWTRTAAADEISPCPACGSHRARKLFTKKGRDFFRCRACGLERQHPLPSAEALRTYYDASYADGMYRAFTAAEEMKRRTALQRLREMPCAGAGRWLDVGCANGVFVETARGRGIAAEGIDLSGAAVAEAKARALPVERATVEDWDGGPYDTITAFDVLEHVLDPLAALGAMHRLLAPGGRLVLTVPNQRSVIRRVMGRRWFFYIPEEHLHYFNPRTIRLLLARVGFETERCARAHKPLTWSYSLLQLAEYNPFLHRLLAGLGRLVPATLHDRSVPLYIGEMLVVARRNR